MSRHPEGVALFWHNISRLTCFTIIVCTWHNNARGHGTSGSCYDRSHNELSPSPACARTHARTHTHAHTRYSFMTEVGFQRRFAERWEYVCWWPNFAREIRPGRQCSVRSTRLNQSILVPLVWSFLRIVCQSEHFTELRSCVVGTLRSLWPWRNIDEAL